jgi:hypothetical protein
MTSDETPCPREARGDCRSSAELLADGTLRMDPWGERRATPLTGTVPAATLAELRGAFGAPELVALLDQPKACTEANATETMLVRVSGVEHRNETGYCNDAAIQNARGAMVRLAGETFPDHSLITPPF